MGAWQHAVVSRYPTPAVFVEIKDGSNFAPIYVQEEIDQTRRVNFDPMLWKTLTSLVEDPVLGVPNEIQIFDYIFGVLSCPAYRDAYSEFLKIDFPRIPWPQTPQDFWAVSGKGTSLRKLQLMDSTEIGETNFPFVTVEGQECTGKVNKISFNAARVWINRSQYFENVPEISWNGYIGGYQPARKWLKDRKGRILNSDDIYHYQKIIKIVSEVHRITNTIEMKLQN